MWREKKIFGELKPRTNAVATLHVFASERENNFSAMNNIMTTNCCPLNIPTVATLLC
jgi:hypothetical protein